MCKSGLRKVLTVRLSVLMNETQASPGMSLHRAWVSGSTRTQTPPLHPSPSACIMWSGPWLLRLWPEPRMAQMQLPWGPASSCLHC